MPGTPVLVAGIVGPWFQTVGPCSFGGFALQSGRSPPRAAAAIAVPAAELGA